MTDTKVEYNAVVGLYRQTLYSIFENRNKMTCSTCHHEEMPKQQTTR